MTRIAETAGLDDDGRVVLRDLFLYVDEGVDDDGTCHGHFEATGTRPRFIDDFDKAAVSLPDDLFDAPG